MLQVEMRNQQAKKTPQLRGWPSGHHKVYGEFVVRSGSSVCSESCERSEAGRQGEQRAEE
jgi:hypothetical protein